jgi:hypothetical protein
MVAQFVRHVESPDAISGTDAAKVAFEAFREQCRLRESKASRHIPAALKRLDF